MDSEEECTFDDLELSSIVHNGEKHDRVIVHIDIDCFYAQVETLLNPSLKGKPLGVQQKFLVVTCNYEARKRGVQKCSSVKAAKEVCPDLVLVNGEDLKNYRKYSEDIYNLLQTFSPLVEKLGLDENFIDITERLNALCFSDEDKLIGNVYGDVDKDNCSCGCYRRLLLGSIVAQEIRDKLHEELQISSCAGISYNKLLAKVGGSVHKPNQQTTIFPCSALQLINSLDSPRRIPGIGSSMLRKLEMLSIKTVSDLQSADMSRLSKLLGANLARQVQRLSFGVDDAPVKTTAKPKSIGAEDGFPRVSTLTEISAKIRQLLCRVWDLVQRDGRLPTSVKFTVRKSWKSHSEGKSIRESRQSALDPSVFAGCKQSRALTETQQKKLVQTLMNLFLKIVATDHFEVTLVGISFGGFPSAETSPQKNSIDKYFTMKHAETTRAPVAKKARLSPTVGSDPSESVRAGRSGQEMICSRSSGQCQSPVVAIEGDRWCPEGIDPFVLSQLPDEIQAELRAEWANHRPQPARNSVPSAAPATKRPRNLRDYFHKV